jgi:hypothetical protein
VRQNKNNPITLVIGKTTLTNVTGAKKFTGRQITGSEPYTDVVINIGKKSVANVSMKGESAPSMAGGGLRGIQLASPGLGKRYFEQVLEYLTKTVKLKPGDKVPDIYGKIPKHALHKIVIGNVQMGGPIDYIFIGPMTVSGRYDMKSNTLYINRSELYDAEKYAKTHDLYFRLRARRIDQRFDPEARDKDGSPKIYGKSPSKGDSVGRLVVVNEDAIPNNAKTINIR